VIDAPSIALAFVAGIVSFLSPCSLPLVPGYLAAVSGRPPGAESSGRRLDPRTLAGAGLFVLTFSTIFILLGLSATALGALLFDNQLVLRKVAGVTIIGLGLLFVASIFVGRLNREFRPARLIERAGRGGPVVAGAAFALAWTPCVGPTLGAILGLASTQESTLQGAGLLAVYSAGLAIPFLFAAAAFGAAQRSFGWFKRHYGAIQAASGVLLIGMGVLVLTGELFRINIEIQQALDGLGLNIFRAV
jgi:cytochrome c-type biogenesis protein